MDIDYQGTILGYVVYLFLSRGAERNFFVLYGCCVLGNTEVGAKCDFEI